MLTADTITDEQLRELRCEMGRTLEQRTLAAIALNEYRTASQKRVLEARARCAEILNQRRGAK